MSALSLERMSIINRDVLYYPSNGSPSQAAKVVDVPELQTVRLIVCDENSQASAGVTVPFIRPTDTIPVEGPYATFSDYDIIVMKSSREFLDV
jgi:hypothetical protein